MVTRACSKTLFKWACVLPSPLVRYDSSDVCRHELRSRFHHVFSCGFPAVKKCSLCAPLLDTQGSICSPLTGYVTPLPNLTKYATKIGAKGTGRLYFDYASALGSLKTRKKKAPKPRIQHVVRRFFFRSPALSRPRYDVFKRPASTRAACFM